MEGTKSGQPTVRPSSKKSSLLQEGDGVGLAPSSVDKHSVSQMLNLTKPEL